jgi:hypothetical protein
MLIVDLSDVLLALLYDTNYFVNGLNMDLKKPPTGKNEFE